jgi:hypothetical protein
MTDFKEKKPISAYQQLYGILNSLKTEEISLNDAMNKIQLKELKPTRPYCKVTGSGALALYGVSKQPIVLYADQWNKLLKVTKSDYIDNYIKYNESRLKFKKNFKKRVNHDVNQDMNSDESKEEEEELNIEVDNIESTST